MTIKREKWDLHLFWLAIFIAIAGVLLALLGPILTPFLLAAILAYICNPAVTRLEKTGIRRTFGVVLMLLLLLGMIVLLLLIMAPLFGKQMELFMQRLPAYLDWLRLHLAPWLKQTLGVDLLFDGAHLRGALAEHWQGAQGVAEKFLPSFKSGGMALMTFAMNMLLVPVVLFYVLRDWDVIMARIDEMIPRRWHGKTHVVAGEIDIVLAAFLRGQISVIVLMSVFYVLALWLAGLELALPIGLLAGLLGFVPYLGLITGLGLATLAALMQFQSLDGVMPVWIVFAAGQALEGVALTPWLVGERIGLHPVAVIFALLAFGQVFGFFGVLLALPVSAALLVAARHARAKYLESELYHS